MTMDVSDKSFRRENRLAVFEHVVKKEKDSKCKTFIANRLESEESSPSDSELIIDDEGNEQVKKNKKLLVRLTEEPLNLKCEWNYCHICFNSWQKFNAHLTDHARDESDSLECLWNNCNITCDSVDLLIQHVSYHGYLSKLRNIGQNTLDRNNLPDCTQNEICVIPVSPDGYTCEWELCSVNMNTVYEYFSHVEQHVRGNPRIARGDDVIICYWNGCNSKFNTRYKLGEHMRTHTRERAVGCPKCCTLFSNKTKFCDHRRRQLSTEMQSYQCSQCLKLFPSERLLRDHMRSHINHYKCTMCDMTCSKPSILAKHIRFKHVKDKPFECTECDKTFVTKHNLNTHLATHKEEALQCDICDFKCRTQVGLQNHYVKRHDQYPDVYECHCCKKHFKRGGHLTKHLMKVHNYHWPSGHSRFRYRKDQDGIYRLQTVRYESLEVTEEMIKSETLQSKNSFSVKLETESASSYVLSVADDDVESKIAEEQHNDVLITINDIDEHGNIVRSQVMKSKEIIGSVSDDKLFVTESGFPIISGSEECIAKDSLKSEFDECISIAESDVLGTEHHVKVKNETIPTTENLKLELNEFVEISDMKHPLHSVANESAKKSGNKRTKNKSISRKNKVLLRKRLKTGTDQLQIETEEFVKFYKRKKNVKNAKISKRKQLVSEMELKGTNVVKSINSTTEERRRKSKRLQKSSKIMVEV